MIRLKDHNPMWAVRFEKEASALHRALGDLARRIEHVGSTAVPGMIAKPVIDIQVSVPTLGSLDPFMRALHKLGYVHLADPDPEFERRYPYFHKPKEWPHTFHVHLCEQGGLLETRHIAFRDRLRNDAAARQEYAALKRVLAGRYPGPTHEERQRYTDAKSDFVRRMLADLAE